jgi:photosynthetic reaction center cytochrome c subunit
VGRSRLAEISLRVAAIAWAGSAAILAAQGAAGDRPQMAEEVFKNIQLLRGIPVDQFMGTMGVFSAATGLNCTDCHGEESGGNWARYADEHPRKQMARRMMQMVEALNKTSFGGRQVVTCFTCHRGTSRPSVMPSIDLLYSSPPPIEPGDLVGPARGQPTPDQVLEKYIQALGGADRVKAVTSLTAKGRYIGFDDADKTPMELYAQASPARRTIISHTASGDLSWVYDGQSAWVAAPLTDRPIAVIPVTGQDLEGLGVEVQAWFPLGIRQRLTNLRVGFPTEIGDREVNVLQGTTANGGVVTLCFDAETGLLARLIRYAASPVGRIVTRVDYADYRETAGVKLPFRWTLSWLNGRSVFELDSVQANVAIEATRFTRPAAPVAPRR